MARIGFGEEIYSAMERSNYSMVHSQSSSIEQVVGADNAGGRLSKLRSFSVWKIEEHPKP